MRDILIKEDFHLEIDPKAVLQLIQCYENSPVYEEVLTEYEELKNEVLKRIQLKAVLSFTTIEQDYSSVLPLNSPVLYLISTLGEEIVELSRRYFDEDEYLKGMIVDAIGDAVLFGVDEQLQSWMKEECIKRGFGVSHRYEAPTNVPMEFQKIAYEATKANENLGISITSGYMYDPVKSNCQVLALTYDKELFQLEHDCSACDNLNCPVRRVPDVTVTVVTSKEEKLLVCREKESLLGAMIREGIMFSSICQGNGTCGKCKVQLIDGHIDITLADEKHFTKNDLELGWRLACQAHPKENCKINLIKQDESTFEVLSDYKEVLKKIVSVNEEDYSIAVDIGTTTIAISLVGNTSKLPIDTFTTVNGQRSMGADVISRIQASVSGQSEALRGSIRKDLLTGIKELLVRNNLGKNLIKEIVIAGNTTMGHLLMGFDCSKLGISPFLPVNINLIKASFEEVFKSTIEEDCKITLLPGISAFVGADIVSGLYFCDFFETDKINILIDLGTNGEMAIGNRNQIITTSTAAGPAFEAGNITWGVGSIKGAISSVIIDNNKVHIRTIGDKEPIGICGTGVIEAVAELVKKKIIDETGLIAEEYFDEGYPLAKTPTGESIVLTQKDIRELQLAKSAIRAGVETLCLRYGVLYDQVDKVYLAGGFGVKLNQEKAITIGLLPEEFSGKIEAIGNSSLGGAVKYIMEDNSHDILKHIISISSEINLANDKAFNDFYMDHMFFGDSE